MNLKAKCYRTYDGREFSASECTECGLNGYLVFENSRGREFVQFRIWALDVWGNERDGFEVNDRSQCGLIWLPLDASKPEIIKALKREGLLKRGVQFRSFAVGGDDLNIHIEARRTSEPLYQLEVG